MDLKWRGDVKTKGRHKVKGVLVRERDCLIVNYVLLPLEVENPETQSLEL